MRLRPALAAALALLLPAVAAQAAAVKVVFSATSDQFGNEPFTAGSVLSGEFILDLDAPRLSAPACPAGAVCLDGAVSAARFSVGALPFTASDIDVQLTPLSSGVFISLRAPAGGGARVTGTVPERGLSLVDVEFEARFAASFYPQALTALDLKRDFTLLVGRLLFAPAGQAGPLTTFTVGQGEFTSLVVNEVPAPAAGWCLLAASSTLAGLRRRAGA